jgi:hypothetical protein
MLKIIKGKSSMEYIMYDTGIVMCVVSVSRVFFFFRLLINWHSLSMYILVCQTQW